MDVHLLVLNYNGRALLADCLPSIVAAAARYRRAGRGAAPVTVIDNSSTDGSAEFVTRQFPGVGVVVEPNRGLCSFNAVASKLAEPALVLLNNDLRLDEAALGPFVEPLEDPSAGRCFLTAARTLRASDGVYDGQKTAVAWRCGLVQATSLYAGHENSTEAPSLTASAGAAIAVDRALFVELGGFDPMYLPGRLEDLDLAFRAWQRGLVCCYVPEAVAHHVGAASFERDFGAEGCQRLALRNTLLWQWKNLRDPGHRLRQAAGLTLRAALDLARWPLRRRLEFLPAVREAIAQWIAARDRRYDPWRDARREREFFRRFHPSRIDGPAARTARKTAAAPPQRVSRSPASEARHA